MQFLKRNPHVAVLLVLIAVVGMGIILTHDSHRTSSIQPDSIIEFILEQEGGYNPADPSFEGVYQPTWEGYVKMNNLSGVPKHVKDLQGRHDLVVEFYHWYLYEQRSGITSVPEWFRLMLADFWVTSMYASIKPLQKWAEIQPNGIWGTATETAVVAKFAEIKDRTTFARWYTEQRKMFYRTHGYADSHPLMARADLVLAETLKSLHGTNIMTHRTLPE